MYEPRNAEEVISTKRIWSAKPFLIAYVVAVSFTIGLLVNRAPHTGAEAVPVIARGEATQHGNESREVEAKEPPLWLQLFRPSPPTARLLLRMALPMLTVADGSAEELERREFLVYWTGHAGERPQTLFQTMLPFLRPEPPRVVEQPPKEPEPPAPVKPPTGKDPPDGEPDPPPLGVAGGLPLVGIYHTHDWESYLSEFPLLHLQRREDLNRINSESHAQRTILGIGKRLSEHLQDEGVASVWARATHQELGYDYAYRSSRSTARQILREWPSVKILLDLHRDAAWGLDTTKVINGERVAQIRCIIGDQNPKWEQNKAFCELLMEYVEAEYPGLTLPTRVQKGYTYNQDLLPGALLLEIGNAPNHYDEAERAVGLLAKAVAELVRDGKYLR